MRGKANACYHLYSQLQKFSFSSVNILWTGRLGETILSDTRIAGLRRKISADFTVVSVACTTRLTHKEPDGNTHSTA